MLVVEGVANIDGGNGPAVLSNDIGLHAFVKKCNK